MRWVFLVIICGLAACSGPNSSGQVTRQFGASDFSFAVQQIIPVATQLCGARRADDACDFEIVIDERAGRAPNAFQSVGQDGQPVLTFTASLIAEARNADEIALIVAHEAAHHIDGHLGQLNQEVARIQALGAVANTLPAEQAWADVNAKLRGFELAADTLGAEIAIAAGFDPAKAVQILERLPHAADHVGASHPAHHDRVLAVKSASP
jgi:predicted Zn-dependent protease